MTAPTIPAPLIGKVAIVTGGSRGIGRGCALAFAKKGIAKIAITYASNSSAAEETVREIQKIRSDIKTTAIKADILSPTFATDVVAQTLSDLSTDKIDIVVSNAPYADTSDTPPLSEATKKTFDSFMAGNAWAPTQLCLAALPHMPRGGRVIMISSCASRQSNPTATAIYGASKAALDSFTRSLAGIYSAEKGITINSVSVGATMTDLIKTAMEVGALPRAYVEDVLQAKHTAGNRLGEVDDVADIVTFLASDESRWINGNSIPANGGSMLEAQG